MKFHLTMDEFTLIQNAIHYYKHVEKRGNFQKYDKECCESLRDKLSKQLVFQDYEAFSYSCPVCGESECTCPSGPGNKTMEDPPCNGLHAPA